MVYKVLDISRYVINKSIESDNPISNLKLQKVLYYIQAAFLVNKSEPCFNEPILNWRHGPVIEIVYQEYKKFQNSNINEPQLEYKELKIDKNLDFEYKIKYFNSNLIKPEDRKLIDDVISSYSSYTPWELVRKTHNEDPWISTERNEEINKELIQNYYKTENLIYGKQSI